MLMLNNYLLIYHLSIYSLLYASYDHPLVNMYHINNDIYNLYIYNLLYLDDDVDNLLEAQMMLPLGHNY